jgi:hypothetical protein
MFGYYAKHCREGLRVGTFVNEGALGQRGMVPQVDRAVLPSAGSQYSREALIVARLMDRLQTAGISRICCGG